MFKKISNNLILFGIVAMSFVLVNNASAASDVTYAFSGGSTGGYFNDEYSSYSGYDNPYLFSPGYGNYNNYGYNNTNTGSKTNPTASTSTSNTNPTVVNNYYYNTSAPSASASTKTAETTSSKTATSTNTVSSVKVASASTTGVGYYNDVPLAKEANNGRTYSATSYVNNLGASAYGANNYGISSSFMPNTFFGWVLTILLVMAIIVVYRMILRKHRETKVVVKA